MSGIIKDTKVELILDRDENIVEKKATVTTRKYQKNSGEPGYIKVYFNGLNLLDELPLKCIRLLLELTKYMVYADINDFQGGQTITLTPAVKQDIKDILKIKDRTLSDYMKALVDNKLIRKIGYNYYQINPKIIGKGYFEYKPQCKMGGIKNLVDNWEKGFQTTEVENPEEEVISILEKEMDNLVKSGCDYEERKSLKEGIKDYKNTYSITSQFKMPAVGFSDEDPFDIDKEVS